ncbi:hypothetical protein CKO44_16475 [Rubrivivax gelatinosus]|uniref:Uncharacterized protein n=1 Tax=Rubrivivax gelatinosus TaxID=28068 RepID=A0ABS1E1J1_RUBGE|nr:hypothetical protein [Rubrivivax gelatinosus]MBK1615066.1 hypothetical protein [Rubrivivax gelatinosus]MBK1714752.1 hypothetical protein [Rubrivivax gelatinosus]
MNLLPAARAAAALLLAGTLALPAAAGPALDAVSTCMADNTTGKERKDLTRWIFIAMAAHPGIADLAAVGPGAAEDSQRRVATLVMQLLTERCVDEVRAMVRSEGPDAMGKAFETLGRVAFMELTTNAAVTQSLQGFVPFLDRERFQRALSGR